LLKSRFSDNSEFAVMLVKFEMLLYIRSRLIN
jgi:hypothetical protein